MSRVMRLFAWGRRVLINRKLGLKGEDASKQELSELTYLLESGSDRTGALDFQLSATKYTPLYNSAVHLCLRNSYDYSRAPNIYLIR